MREIKFRAWDGKKYHKVCRIGLHGFSTDLWSPSPVSCDVRMTETLTFEQFTGLHDKNGREIYEGDIIIKRWWSAPYSQKAKSKQLNCIIEWNNDQSRYDICPIDTNHGMRGYDGHELSNVEIIGNIHENPELLEVLK